MKALSAMLILFFASAIFAYSEELPPPQSGATSETAATISGRVMIKGKTPMANGIVLLFNKEYGPPPHPYRYWRIPDLINGTDMRGNFSIEVPEGTYYLMIAQKKPNGEIGPPKEKEFLYFHGDLKGNPTPIIVTSGAKVNLGVLSKAFLWSPKMVQQDREITSIEGIVANMDGTPVKQAIVFAYLSQNTVGRPAFISDKTDKNGRYQLRLYEGGTYYLKVRSVIGGGAPEAGEYQSATKEFVPTEVTLAKGQQLKGIALKVAQFSGKGSTGIVKAPKIWKNTGSLQAK